MREIVMPAAYSLDLRTRVFQALESGKKQKEIAKQFNVSISFIKSLKRLYQEQKTLKARPHGGGNPSIITDERFSWLRVQIEKNSDLLLEELCLLFEKKFNISIAISTMDQNLRKRKITRKKNLSRSKTRKSNATGSPR
jgi:transposase